MYGDKKRDETPRPSIHTHNARRSLWEARQRSASIATESPAELVGRLCTRLRLEETPESISEQALAHFQSELMRIAKRIYAIDSDIKENLSELGKALRINNFDLDPTIEQHVRHIEKESISAMNEINMQFNESARTYLNALLKEGATDEKVEQYKETVENTTTEMNNLSKFVLHTAKVTNNPTDDSILEGFKEHANRVSRSHTLRKVGGIALGLVGLGAIGVAVASTMGLALIPTIAAALHVSTHITVATTATTTAATAGGGIASTIAGYFLNKFGRTIKDDAKVVDSRTHEIADKAHGRSTSMFSRFFRPTSAKSIEMVYDPSAEKEKTEFKGENPMPTTRRPGHQ